MLGIPVRGDQFRNLKIAQEKGYAIYIPFASVTVEKLREAVNKLFVHERYYKK